MLQGLPWHISAVFICTTLLTVFLFFLAARRSVVTLAVVGGWALAQAILAYSGFYQLTGTVPPRFIVLIAPPLILIIFLFFTSTGKRYLDQLDFTTLMILHTIRIPVELVLYWLFLYKAVPQLLTFEGRNLDILSGITAPFVVYFGIIRQKLGRTVMLAWNLLCLALLINVVVHGILSAPTVFQKLAFEQPNTGMMYFPFAWLPSVIVPLVLVSHLACIRQVLRKA